MICRSKTRTYIECVEKKRIYGPKRQNDEGNYIMRNFTNCTMNGQIVYDVSLIRRGQKCVNNFYLKTPTTTWDTSSFLNAHFNIPVIYA